MGYNYPCSWENALALVGHAQTLLLMGKGTTSVDLTTAFNKLTNDASYGADQSLVAAGNSTAAALYSFAFSYSTGLCVAHGVKASHVGTLTTVRHALYMAAADAGGGWVSCEPAPASACPFLQAPSWRARTSRGRVRCCASPTTLLISSNALSRMRALGRMRALYSARQLRALSNHTDMCLSRRLAAACADPWKNSPNEPEYQKSAYVVKVTREGESYYVGTGLAQQSYALAKNGAYWSECSINWKGACAESWAHRLAGERISKIQNATSRADLFGTLNTTSDHSTGGFGTYVHSVGADAVVMADGFHRAQVGISTSKWLSSLGLASDALDSAASSSGYTWLGPFSSFRVRPSASPQPHYLLFVPVPIEGRLTPNPEDGIGDRLNLIVPVGASNPRLLPKQPNTCTALCVDHAEYKDRCSKTSKVQQCPIGTAAAAVAAGGTGWSSSHHGGCARTFADTQPFGSNSEFGLMAWVDEKSTITMCGCADGYEAALTPIPTKEGEKVGTSVCVAGVASAAEVDMHTPVHTVCAQSSPPVNIAGLVLSIVLPILSLALIAWFFYRRHMKGKLGALRQELESFKDSVRGREKITWAVAEHGARPARSPVAAACACTCTCLVGASTLDTRMHTQLPLSPLAALFPHARVRACFRWWVCVSSSPPATIRARSTRRWQSWPPSPCTLQWRRHREGRDRWRVPSGFGRRTRTTLPSIIPRTSMGISSRMRARSRWNSMKGSMSGRRAAWLQRRPPLTSI